MPKAATKQVSERVGKPAEKMVEKKERLHNRGVFSIGQ